MVESMRDNGSMGSMKALGYYRILRGRSLLASLGVGRNGEGELFYLRIVGLMAFGMGIGLTVVCILIIKMGILIWGLSIRIFRSMETGSINSRIMLIAKASFEMMNL